MSFRRLPRPKRRRGLSEMVGALFILILLVVAFSFALVMFNSFSGYQSAVNTRAQYNAQLPREALTYDKVVFGASTQYPTGNSFIGSFASSAPSEFFPVSNMNFTTGSQGWTFTRQYLQPGVFGMSGNYDPITSVGSSSGPGEIFTDFTYNQGASGKWEAIGNWTTQFTLSSAQVAALATGTSNIVFRIADDLYTSIQSQSGYPILTAYLQDVCGLPHCNEQTLGSPTPTSITWQIFEYCFDGTTPSGTSTCASVTAQHTFFAADCTGAPSPSTCNSETYNFVLKSDIALKGQSSTLAEQRIYFDDTGVELLLQGFFSATRCPTFTISQNPLSVQDLTFSVTTSYTQPVTQNVYLWDYAQGTLTQIDTASVGASATTRFVDLGGLVGGASEVQRFINPAATTNLAVPGCGTLPSVAQGEVIMKIYSVGTGVSFTGTLSADLLTAFYTSTSQFSVELTNTGTSTIHLVSFWITGSSGPVQFASTLAGNSYFEQWVAPGQTVSMTVTYSWSAGQYTLEFVSALGNMFSESVTAG